MASRTSIPVRSLDPPVPSLRDRIATKLAPYAPEKLPLQVRWGLFFGCLFGGFILINLCSSLLRESATHPTFFILYPAALMLTLLSTVWIVGLQKQTKLMQDKSRRTATLVIGASIFLCGVMLLFGLNMMASVIYWVSYLSVLWYCISFIPLCQRLIKMAVSCVVGLFKKALGMRPAARTGA